MARLRGFRCWWCRCALGAGRLHHRAPSSPARPCCHECYHREGSNYRRVYDGEEQEREEVARQRGLGGGGGRG